MPTAVVQTQQRLEVIHVLWPHDFLVLGLAMQATWLLARAAQALKLIGTQLVVLFSGCLCPCLPDTGVVTQNVSNM
jgi:hypothetical protein